MPSDSIPLVRQIAPDDRDWVAATLVRDWTSTSVARLGELVEGAGLPGYVATLSGRRVGLGLIDVRDRDVEVVAISRTEPRRGVGRALMARCSLRRKRRGAGGSGSFVTTNNVAAIDFYQRLSMDLSALHRHAVRVSRERKPTIPARDAAGVPTEHELEFELLLQG